ncbi:Threonine dehydrogenase [Singulisphaera sp. GP187]|uniref:glucose 1-dehydrogenase n=1 Tax=Singulisphaera sp. GP187 TaxID=1882752 RepID=UPI0009276815|nr:glucose 1-dehydrogenase [Singulisphaera sp. GP187]SIN96065.1 Threonine dehydrogenase [Singulisphaera sp. GP187]
MKAVAVLPGQPNSVHLQEIPVPKVTDQPHPHVCRIPEGRGVLVKVLQIGVDATDREINEALYGNAPPGGKHLVIGHESFGQVVEVGDKVIEIKPGDYVTCTVRRPGGSLFDKIGRNDITSEEVYYERGINLCHGYLTEYFVDDAEYVVKVPQNLKHLGVLAEPASVCAKAIEQAYLAQQRLQVWNPLRAFVLGSGQIGLLATMMLRLRGLQVFTLATKPGPHLKSELAEAYGATYVSTKQTSMKQLTEQVGKPDLIFEATGNAEVCFRAMEVLAHNGALIWTSITGGEHEVSVDAAKINLEWVLGNKLLVSSVNGNRRHFELGIQALSHGEHTYPGVTERILTHPVAGLENYQEMMKILEDNQALKVYVDVAK